MIANEEANRIQTVFLVATPIRGTIAMTKARGKHKSKAKWPISGIKMYPNHLIKSR
jgi:hypothetical protein